MKTPFFSIITPVYNRVHIVGNALQSVLQQNYQDWELLLVDDGSSDHLKEYIATHFTDPRIQYLTYGDNRGASSARNYGIEHARGGYIVFLDSDNTLDPGFLSAFHEAIKDHPESRIFWCGVSREIFKQGVLDRIEKYCWKPDQRDPLFFLKAIRISTGRGLVVERKAFINAGGFDTRLPAAEDTEMLLRLFPGNSFFVIDQYLYRATIHEGYRLTTDYHKQAAAYDIILDKHLAYFKKHRKVAGRFFRKAAHYHYLNGNLKRAWKCLLQYIRIYPFSAKTYYYILPVILSAIKGATKR